MFRLTYERIKLYFLITLIIASLIQVGILWNYQDHGFPSYFLGNLFNTGSTYTVEELNSDKEEIFQPYRITVSKGFDESHWIISKKQKELYAKIFGEVQFYLIDILGSDHMKGKTVRTLTENDIGELAVKNTAFSIEFKANINLKLLACFFNIKDLSNSEIESINKVIILPEANDNYKSCTLVILDYEHKKYYEYILPFHKNMSRDDYIAVIETLKNDSNLINYKVIKEVLPNFNSKKLDIRKDILFVATLASKFKSYYNIVPTSPEVFSVKNGEYDDLARNILLKEKDNYDYSVDIYNANVFRNVDSVYRVYEDGLMEHKNLSSPEGMEKGDIDEAFTNVLEFIGKRKVLLKDSSAVLYLSGFYEEKDRYRFVFDYQIDGTPVYFEYNTEGRDKRVLNNAITIEANSKKILSCWWIFKNFKKTEVNEYNLYFMDLLNNLDKVQVGTETKETLTIKDINVCYQVKAHLDNHSIEPAWMIEPQNDAPYLVPLEKNKDKKYP